MLKEIHIDELTPGMLIHKVFTSDTSIDVLFRNFHAKNNDDIDRLKKSGIKRVIIDLSRKPAQPTQQQPVRKANTPEQRYENLKADVKVAEKVFEESKAAIESFYNASQDDGDIQTDDLAPILDKTFNSIRDNNQALLTILHMHRNSEKFISHIFSVLGIVTAIGHRMNFDGDNLFALGLSALLHDIGWSRLPTYLPEKSLKYSEKELKLAKLHAQYGLSIIEKIKDLPEGVINILKEYYVYEEQHKLPPDHDDTLYANMGKLITIVDIYDSLTHGIKGNNQRTPYAALQQLYKQAQRGDIDTEILTQLIKLLGVYPISSAIELESGERGIVIELNKEHPLRPIIKICYDKHKTPINEDLIVNLSEEDETSGRKIKGIIDPEIVGVDPYDLLKIDSLATA